jgi:hypothetical protein
MGSVQLLVTAIPAESPRRVGRHHLPRMPNWNCSSVEILELRG